MTWGAFDDTESNSEEDIFADDRFVEEEQASQRKLSASCCSRLLHELRPCQPHFIVLDRATGRIIDVPESFSPIPTFGLVAFKTFGFMSALASFVFGWVYTATDGSYLARASSWMVPTTCLYFFCSLGNTVMASRTPQPSVSVGLRMKTTWLLAELASHSTGVVSVAFWYMNFMAIFNDPNDIGSLILDIFNHGPLPIVLWLDVFYINRIPFRWIHWVFYVCPIECVFVGLTLAYSYLNDKDLPLLGWDLSLKECGIYASAGVGAAIVIFWVQWFVSVYHLPCLTCRWSDKRRYLDSFKDKHDPRPTVDDIEEGSIFQRWS